MRIGIDTRLAHYRRAGGIAQYTLRLLQALAELANGDELVVLHHYGDRLAGLLTLDEAEAKRVRGHLLFTAPHHRREQWALPAELLFAGLDVLHSPDFIPPFRRRCASVITVHDLAFKLYPNMLTAESMAYYGQIERAVASAEQIIAVSEATRQDMLRLLPVDGRKISVIHEAADTIYRPLDDRTPSGRGGAADPHRRDADSVQQVLRKYRLASPFVLAVGTIEPRKNLSMLLRAFRALLDRDTSRAQLVIAGPRGWLADDLAALHAQLRLGEQARFLGAVPAPELAALYNAADLFVMPSLYEGFGLPVAEAMACGAPVIVSNVSSLPEVAGDAGLCLDPNDVDAWAETMRRVLGDPALRANMRQQSLRQARLFSWERAARETLAVYHKATS
jgi:glycosyltransferase involved in cell wall biosynthesis